MLKSTTIFAFTTIIIIIMIIIIIIIIMIIKMKIIIKHKCRIRWYGTLISGQFHLVDDGLDRE